MIEGCTEYAKALNPSGSTKAGVVLGEQAMQAQVWNQWATDLN